LSAETRCSTLDSPRRSRFIALAGVDWLAPFFTAELSLLLFVLGRLAPLLLGFPPRLLITLSYAQSFVAKAVKSVQNNVPVHTMHHIDLFTGIGGFALGLEGISSPCLYCDNNLFVQQVLQDKIKEGRLPDAPFAPDVESVIRTSVHPSHKPDLIVGSFPCVGMSTAGLRQGFQEKQTGLFHELLRVIDIFQTPFIFMENVANILTIGMAEVAAELSDKRGYELRWITMPAYAVGLPHMRRRWYCLGVQKDLDWSTVLDMPPYQHIPCMDNEPDRMIMQKSQRNNEAIRSLGNALVPACARLAFMFLFSNYTCTSLECTQLKFQNIDTDNLPPAKEKVWPPSGVHRQGSTWQLPQPKFPKPNLNITLVGQPLPAVVSPQLSCRLVTEARLPLWATPRASSISSCNVLTWRSARDLATQLRFEASTVEESRFGKPNPRWVQWLMGFPTNWVAD